MEVGNKEFLIKYGQKHNFYFMGDFHEGNCNQASEAIKQAVRLIKNDEDCGGVFGGGDYTECIINSQDPRFNPIEIAEEYAIRDLKDLPKKQAERLYMKLKPIENKFLAFIIGNHEEQYIKRHSFDVYDSFVSLFPNNPIKLGKVGFFKLKFRTGGEHNNWCQNILIALNHGIGGTGFREGYPLNKLHDIFRWTRADVSVCFHMHRLVEDEKHFITVGNGEKFKRIRVLYGIGGGFLKTYVQGNTNYFEDRGRYGSDIGMLKLEATCIRGKTGAELSYKLEKIKL